MFILLLLLIIGLIYFLRQKDQRDLYYSGHPEQAARQSGQSGDAFDILRERYARGEIDEQEFNERKKVLQQP